MTVRTGPRVVAVVLHYGDPDDTVAAVRSIAAGSWLDATVAVVDNDEEPDPDALRRRLDPTVRYLPAGGNLGYAGGNNLGLQLARELGADYAWLVNPDARAGVDALAELVAAADATPTAALVGSRLVAGTPARIRYDGAEIDVRSGETRLLREGMPADEAPAGAAIDTDYAHGASVLVRTARLPLLGLIPEQYFLYFEETDWALRARALGLRVLVAPRSVVVHERRSARRIPSAGYVYYMVRNREIFAATWGFDIDGARGVTDQFVSGWRRRLAQARPDLLDRYDALVAAARADGAAGVVGRSDVPDRLAMR
ncbi:MAG: glycosyltransferase family 2 protein [Actinomycetota bacterium]|nr:MAG: glycosyltransferase family 2 protein [Actinomycetota bacterium]